MTLPGFGSDQKSAQAVVRERNDVSRLVGRFQDYEARLADLRLLWEMAVEETDESLETELLKTAQELDQALRTFEIERLLSGKHDQKNAILSIHSGAGGTESQDWAQMLMRMY